MGPERVFLANAIVLLVGGVLAGRFLSLSRLEGQVGRAREEAEPAPGRTSS